MPSACAGGGGGGGVVRAAGEGGGGGWRVWGSCRVSSAARAGAVGGGPAGGREVEPAVEADVRAERAERVEVRVEPAAADHVAARRRHVGAAKSCEKRTREQERGSDPVGRLRIHRGRVHVLRAERHHVV